MVYVFGVNIRAISISFRLPDHRYQFSNHRNLASRPSKASNDRSSIRKLRETSISSQVRRWASNCVATHQLIDVADPARILAQRQDYPITKAIYELYQLLGDGRLIASALGVWAMCFLGTTMVVPASSWAKKLGAIFRV